MFSLVNINMKVKKKFENSEGVIRICKSKKVRQCNDQCKKTVMCLVISFTMAVCFLYILGLFN